MAVEAKRVHRIGQLSIQHHVELGRRLGSIFRWKKAVVSDSLSAVEYYFRELLRWEMLALPQSGIHHRVLSRVGQVRSQRELVLN